MAEDSFDTTSIGWQIQQAQQRIGEWFELQFARLPLPQIPEATVPTGLLRVLFWLIVGLLLTWLIVQLYQIIRPYWLRLRSPRVSGSSLQRDRTPHRTAADWWQRAQELQRRGDYREACQAFYMATLQHLSERNLIPDQSSRTDGEYFQLVQPLPQPHLYQLLIRTHEQICFGGATISAETCDCCRQAYQEISAP